MIQNRLLTHFHQMLKTRPTKVQTDRSGCLHQRWLNISTVIKMTAIADSQLPAGVVVRVIFTKSLVQDCTKTPNSGVTQDIIGTKHQPCDFLVIWLKFTSHRWRHFWYCSMVFTKVGDPASKHGVVASEPPRGHLNASLTDPQVLVMIQNPTMLNSPECLWCASQNYKTQHFLPVNLHLCRVSLGQNLCTDMIQPQWVKSKEGGVKAWQIEADAANLATKWIGD